MMTPIMENKLPKKLFHLHCWLSVILLRFEMNTKIKEVGALLVLTQVAIRGIKKGTWQGFYFLDFTGGKHL